MKKLLTASTMFLMAAPLWAVPQDCPMHAKHMAEAAQSEHVAAKGDARHGAEVDHRHDSLVMSHETTTHSFRLFADGGAIELRANDPSDTVTIDSVRGHLEQVAGQFARNDFSTPAFVHERAPDGVTGMQSRHDAISFRFESLPTGGRIRMTTTDSQALAAVHDFLKFQVVEHRTKNSGEVELDR